MQEKLILTRCYGIRTDGGFNHVSTEKVGKIKWLKEIAEDGSNEKEVHEACIRSFDKLLAKNKTDDSDFNPKNTTNYE